MTYIEEYYEYLKENPSRANKEIKTVYDKIITDLKQGKVVVKYNSIKEEEEEFVYVFDLARANRPIDFIEKYCYHSKGESAGKPFKLELWQKAFIQASYGFVEKTTRLRKYNKIVLFIGRKNGKSTLAAALGLYHMLFENESGAECYSIATKKDQAKIVWEEALSMVARSPVLKKRTDTKVTGLFKKKDKDTFFKALASDSATLDGLNAYFVACDEIHAWRDMNLYNVMYDSMAFRKEPMILETSTMGTVRESVFDNEYNYFKRVLAGYRNDIDGIVDETVLPFIYELDSRDDIKNEEMWFKANPGLGTIKRYDFIKSKVEKAENDIQEYSNLLCKDFNIRTTDSMRWLDFNDINNEETYSDFTDTYCIGGADLSSTTDLTCATLIAEREGKVLVKQMYWIPSDNLEAKIKDDKIPYDKWYERGYLRLSEGNTINYGDITQWFIEQVGMGLRPIWVGYDSWNANYWKDEMESYGFDMVEVRQGAKTMSGPMKQMGADLQAKKINYNNNPILKWCLTNTAIKEDENGNIRPIKDKQRARIDGAVSLLDAYVIYQDKYTEYKKILGE